MDFEHAAAIIVACTGLFTAAGGILASWYSTRKSARRDEVELLRGEVARLSARLEVSEQRADRTEIERGELYRQLTLARAEIAMLRSVIESHGIAVPKFAIRVDDALADAGAQPDS